MLDNLVIIDTRLQRLEKETFRNALMLAAIYEAVNKREGWLDKNIDAILINVGTFLGIEIARKLI